jgi:cobalamin biosynthesis Co2+ chelatase CbiK
MEQSHDLFQYVQAMRTIKPKWNPFHKIAMGRPALGTGGIRYDYRKDMQKALQTLKADAEIARKQDAYLVYMGHGNEHWSTGINGEVAKMMWEMYPEVVTYLRKLDRSTVNMLHSRQVANRLPDNLVTIAPIQRTTGCSKKARLKCRSKLKQLCNDYGDGSCLFFPVSSYA